MTLQIDVQPLRRDARPETSREVLILGCWAFKTDARADKTDAASLPMIAELAWIDARLDGLLSAVARREDFTGRVDQLARIPVAGRIGARTIILLGLGKPGVAGAVSAASARTLAGRAARAANDEKATSLALVLPEGMEAKLRPVAEGLELGAYRFTKYMTGERRPKTRWCNKDCV